MKEKGQLETELKKANETLQEVQEKLSQKEKLLDEKLTENRRLREAMLNNKKGDSAELSQLI